MSVVANSRSRNNLGNNSSTGNFFRDNPWIVAAGVGIATWWLAHSAKDSLGIKNQLLNAILAVAVAGLAVSIAGGVKAKLSGGDFIEGMKNPFGLVDTFKDVAGLKTTSAQLAQEENYIQGHQADYKDWVKEDTWLTHSKNKNNFSKWLEDQSGNNLKNGQGILAYDGYNKDEKDKLRSTYMDGLNAEEKRALHSTYIEDRQSAYDAHWASKGVNELGDFAHKLPNPKLGG